MADRAHSISIVLDEALLKRFVNGELSSDVEVKVADLVANSPELLNKLAELADDDFIKLARSAQQRSHHIMKSKGASEKAAQVQSPPTSVSLPQFPGYAIVRELGRGGMGVVYLAKNVQMDRLEVLKVLNERLLDHAGAKERFLREIRAVSKLSHPNIVTSYSILALDNLMVFAMEYVHGMDLHKFIHKHGPLPIGLACSFAKQIATGLQHAHERRLVHRDIKPSNMVVFKADGLLQLKILDFGLAKATSEEAAAASGLTQDGTMLGTPEYMSPEQTLDAAKADIRADIYSLGCTLYHMLTGKPPFTGTHGAVLMAHARNEATPLPVVRPEVPAELSAVVAKMIAKDLHKRYQSPAEVAAALLPFINQKKPSPKGAAGPVVASNTVNDLADAHRDTSVEKSLAALSLDVASRVAEPVEDFAAVATRIREQKHAAAQPNAKKISATKSHKATLQPWFLTACISLSVLILLCGLWQLSTLVFKTPNGTIVVENIPPGASVVIDDNDKLDIVWNAGQDRAEVSIAPGDHQLRVLLTSDTAQTAEIFGESVTVKSSDKTLVKLAFKENSVESPSSTSNASLDGSSGDNSPATDSTLTKPSLQFAPLGSKWVGTREDNGSEYPCEGEIVERTDSTVVFAAKSVTSDYIIKWKFDVSEAALTLNSVVHGSPNRTVYVVGGQGAATSDSFEFSYETRDYDNGQANGAGAGVFRLHPLGSEQVVSDSDSVRWRTTDVMDLLRTDETIVGRTLAWQLKDNELWSPQTAWAKIQIPVSPGPEYEIDFTLARRGVNRGALAIGLLMQGRQFCLNIDGQPTWYKSGTVAVTGIDMISGKTCGSNWSTDEVKVIEEQQEHKLKCKVTKDNTISLFCNGELVWEKTITQPRTLSQRPEWRVARSDQLYLGTNGSWAIREWKVSEPID